MNTGKFQKQVGANLKALRKSAGFTSARAFAEHLGMSKDTYTGYEQGRIMMSLERAWTIAGALDCTLDELGTPEAALRAGTRSDPRLASICADFEGLDERGKRDLTQIARVLAVA